MTMRASRGMLLAFAFIARAASLRAQDPRLTADSLGTPAPYFTAAPLSAPASLSATEPSDQVFTGNSVFTISTNLAYLVFSAFTAGGGNYFLAVPIETEFGLSNRFAIRPEAGLLVWRDSGSTAPALALVLDCAFAWYPMATRPRGWYVAAGTGAGLAFDTDAWMILASAEGGYQWLPWKGLLLGFGLGGRLVLMADGSGYIPLPDVRLRLGWAF